MNTKILAILCVIILVLGGVFLLKPNDDEKELTYPTQKENTETPTNIPPVIETPNPVYATPTTPKMQEYSLADVATHNNKNNCWTTINGSVYDLTPWIAEHPGGESAILSLCGIDGTSAFSAQHSGAKRPANELDGFKIGTLKK